MKQALGPQVLAGFLSCFGALMVAGTASADLCEDLLSECQTNAGTAYTACINEEPTNPNCEGIYNVAMNQCTENFYLCNEWGGGGCSPCSSPYYTNMLQFCDDPPEWDYCGCCVRGESPIIVDLRQDGFHLSDAPHGALFSINNGPRRRVAWPLAGDDAWLIWDRNGNGVVDNGREFFGTVTPSLFGAGRFENGYEALKELDANRNNMIDEHDPIFRQLRLWSDVNRNGLSEPTELRNLASAGVRAIGLAYSESRVTDEWGNRFRYWGRVHMSDGTERLSVDVFPVSVNADPKE